MNAENDITELPEVEVKILTGLPSSLLGKIVVSAAAQTLLEMLYLKADYFLQWHESICGESLEKLNRCVNHSTCVSDMHLKSKFFTEAGPVIVVTEPIHDAGKVGVGTRLMLAEEAR